MLNTFKKLPETKQKFILDAATEVFAKNGFYRANVATICEKAGISNGALYKYFKNKEDLFNSVYRYICDLILSEIFKKDCLDKDSIFETIRSVLSNSYQFALKRKNCWTVYMDMGSGSMNYFAKKLSKKLEKEVRNFWIKLVDKGKKNGEINHKVDSRHAAYVIDNNTLLFVFTMISEHHKHRFLAYFGINGKTMSNTKKISIVENTIKMYLSAT